MTTQSATASSAPSPFREYADAPHTGSQPRGELNSFQFVSSNVRLFWHRTKHPLEAILRAGYFDDVADLRLRKEDRIEVVAGDGSSPATHATIVVDSVKPSGGDVVVSLLQRYERAAK
jgi:hypothetical protein